MSEPNRGGRPRSSRSTDAVLSATRDLLAEVGYERMTIDAIAAKAGVGKMTIYRWWSSKSAIVADAVIEGVITIAPFSFPDTGDLRADLHAWLMPAVGLATPPEVAALALAMTAATTGDVRTGEALYERFTGRDRQALIDRLQKEVDAGRLGSDVDLSVAVDMLFGVLLYRLVTRAEPREQYARDLTDLVVGGLEA